MCGGGGCGKIIGLAAAFIVPAFAPAMLGTLGITSALGQTIGSSIIGGLITKATGGNFLMGAAGSLIGSGVNAAFSGGSFDVGSVGNAFNSTTGSGSAGFGFLGNGAGAQNAVGGANAEAISAPSAGEFSNDISGMGAPANVGQASQPLLGNVGSSGLISQPMTSGMGGMGAPGSGGNYGFTNTDASVADTVGLNNGPVLARGDSGGGGSMFDNAGLTASNALKALPQLAGAFGNQGPSTGDLTDYLNKQSGAQQQVFDYNKASTDKKAAIGDKLADTASSIDPSYYGRQQSFATQGQANNQWQDTEAKLRAQGYGDAYIADAKRKQDVSVSQAVGTSYDQGSQAGLNSRNSTYQTAGSMYGNISGPDTNFNERAKVAEKGQNDATAAGKGIEQLFNLTKKTNPTTEET